MSKKSVTFYLLQLLLELLCVLYR